MTRRITTGKYMGDDAYSWAIFVDGQAAVTGLTRSEIAYHKQQITAIYAERDKR